MHYFIINSWLNKINIEIQGSITHIKKKSQDHIVIEKKVSTKFRLVFCCSQSYNIYLLRKEKVVTQIH